MQVRGRLVSFGFSNATDNYFNGEKGSDKLVAEAFNFMVEIATNAAPNLIPEPQDEKTIRLDENKIYE